jgi:hypothetical protein
MSLTADGGFLPQWFQRNLAGAANDPEQERPAISAGFLGESGFLDRKKASVTIPTQLPGPTRAIAKIPPSVQYLLARQAKPQVSWIALGGCGSLVEVHGGSEGPPQRRIVDAGKVPFENRRSFRIIERSDRFAHCRHLPKCQPGSLRLDPRDLTTLAHFSDSAAI